MSRVRFGVLAGALIVVALAIAHYWRMSPAETHADPAPASVPINRTVNHAAVLPALLPNRLGVTQMNVPVRAKESRRLFEVPGDVAKEATADANAGSPDAMRNLASALRECARAIMGSNDEIEQLVAKRSLGRDLLRGDGKKSNPSDDALEAKRLEGIRDSCSQIPKSESDHWLDWFEKSAAAGDSDARAAFAWSALDEYVTPQSKEENADEYLRRRNEAFALLQDSIANGDCSNGILNGFRKVSPDPLHQYVYEGLLLQHALDDYASGKIPYPPNVISQETESINVTLTNLAQYVPEEQRGPAQATIRDILQNYCRQF